MSIIMSKTPLYLICFTLLSATMSFATPIEFWWTGDRMQEGQMTMYNPTAEDGDTGIPVFSADIDNDGYMDAILSCITGDGRYNDKPSCGELHVLFGTDSIRGEMDFSDYDGVHENLLTIWGRSTRDYFGSKSAAGDLDSDGIKDLVVGAGWSNTPGRENSGEVYVIWGGSHLRNRFADLANPADWDALEISNIVGAEADDKLGVWVSCGDVNNDNHDDLLIGAPRANGYANDENSDQTGEAYLLYGPFARNSEIDLANPTHPMTVIFGIDPNDQMGNTVEVGDVNGDDFDDMILGAGAIGVARLGDTDQDYPFETGGAGDGPSNSRDECGEVYIVFGSATLPDTINLADGMPANSTTIYGAHGIEGQDSPGGDELGEEITLGDVNNDGILDVCIGAFRADGRDNDLFWAGANYLFYGRYEWPSVIDLAAGLPDSTTAIYGGGEDWLLGDSTPLGDVNGDGYADIQCGCAHDSGPYDIHKSGTVRIIYGQQELLPPVIDFAAIPDTMLITVIQGSDVSDLVAYWATTGDFNNDGYWDLIPNVMHGDGPNDSRHNAGDFYIISGEWITNHPGQPRGLSAYPFTDRVTLQWQDNGERGSDSHVIYRRDAGSNSEFDSIGYAAFPAHSYQDLTVDSQGSYEYRIKAISIDGYYSNPSAMVSVTMGTSIGDGLPLIVNGIHWDYYDTEAEAFYGDSVLLGEAEFDFWDLYETGHYPGDIEPIGYGIDSLDRYIFDAPLVLWMHNGYDPESSYNDGDMLLESNALLTAYMQAGGKLIIVGKDLDDYLPGGIAQGFAHIVNWGVDNTITSTAELTPEYQGLNSIGKLSTAINVTNLPPFSIDDSGCPLILYSFANSESEWMGELSRATTNDPYNICVLSLRPYRADPSDLRAFMEMLVSRMIGRYPAPEGVTAEATVPGEVTVQWNESPFTGVAGYHVLRQEQSEGATVDTVGFVEAGTNSFVDTVPLPLAIYDYWIVSEHEGGIFSLDSRRASAFSPAPVGDAPLLIVNGLDWETYGQEVFDLYDQHVLQGERSFVFWDLFETVTYPAGYDVVGYGVDSLAERLWQSARTIWVYNNFNGDGEVFEQFGPILDGYLDYGGELFVIGKELHLTLTDELEARLGITEWTSGGTWPVNAEALAEYPLIETVGQGSGSMTLCRQFRLADNENSFPLFRLTGSLDEYVGVMGRNDSDSPVNFALFSIRPNRADYEYLGLAMNYILENVLGSVRGESITDLTLFRNEHPGPILFRWTEVPEATSYVICRKSSLSSPSHIGTIFGSSTTNSWQQNSIEQGTVWVYEVYPVY